MAKSVKGSIDELKERLQNVSRDDMYRFVCKALDAVEDAHKAEIAAIKQGAAKPEPLITKPGRYRERGGGVARVTRKRDVNHYSWAGFNSAGNDATWESSGASHPLRESDNDLIAYNGPLEEETAEPKVYAVTPKNGQFSYITKSAKLAQELADAGSTVYDLSKAESAIVKPVKTEKRKYWVNIYNWGVGSFTHNSKAEADAHRSHWTRIACKEIEFVPGEGL